MYILDAEHPIGSSIIDNGGINFIVLVGLPLHDPNNSKSMWVATAQIPSDILIAWDNR